ncbi:MAG: hypothetical protein WBM48_16160 [Polyangiales bacterium]
MRIITIGLLALVVSGVLPVSVSEAQSPEICAPVEQLDKYRYLRQLTLDLYGRIPTVEEYERLHALDDVTEQMIDEMIGSSEFYDQLRSYHRNLLWANLGDDDLVGQIIQEEGDDTFRVWLNRDKRDNYRGRDVPCLDMEHTNFDTDGRALPMVENYLEGDCAGGEGCTMDGWVEVQPYWARGTTIRVCAFDAQPHTDATPRDDGEPRTCDQVGDGDPLCGCAADLRHCTARGVNYDVVHDALLEEPMRVFEQVIAAGEPYMNALSTRTTAMNGALAHYYRYLARDNDSELQNVPELPYDADWQQVEREPYHSGILTTLGFLRRFASHRARVNRLYTAFLCTPFEAPSGGLPPATDECSQDPNLASRCGCATCHETIEPATTHWGRWEEGDDFVYLEDISTFSDNCANCEKGSCSNYCKTFYITRELETTPGSVDDELGKLKTLAWRTEAETPALDVGPSALVTRPEYQQQIASCAVRSFSEHVFGRELSAEERTGWLTEKTSAFEANGHDFLAMVKDIVTDERYRRIE